MIKIISQSGNAHLALALVRIWTGAMMAYHGWTKLFGSQVEFINYVTTKLQLPEFFAWSAMLAEFVGGCFLVFGFSTRIASLFIVITMCVAVFGTHLNDPWTKKEFALCYLVSGLAFFVAGGGKYSLDSKISQRM